MIMRMFMSLAAVILISTAAAATGDHETAYLLPNSEVHTLSSTELGRSYPVFIALPPGYDAEAAKPYPVILVNDGPYAFPIAAQSLAVPINTGVMEPAILVAIGYSQGDGPMASRMRDYSPSADANFQAFELGEARAYARFIAEEVLPFIETRFHADASRRTLVGHSAGALFGSWVMLNRPDLFESYILISPAFFWDNALMMREEARYAEHHQDLDTRVYFAVGSDERPPFSPFQWVEVQTAFVDQLGARGYPGLEMRSEILDGALHETVFPQAFIRGAQWLLSPAQSAEMYSE